MKSYDTDKEKTVLGSLLRDPIAARSIVPKLARTFGARGKQVFHERRHQAIYEAISELHERGDPIEIPAVWSLLAKMGNGISKDYLVSLATHDSTPVTPEYYAEELKDLAVRREVGKLASRITTRVDGDSPTCSIIEDTQGDLDSLKKERTVRKRSMTILESLEEPLVEAEAPVGGGLLVPGRYAILAATDGEGKTPWCLQLALCAATGTDFLDMFPISAPVVVDYFCGENPRGDINEKVRKQLSELKRIRGDKIESELKNFRIIQPIDVDFLLDKDIRPLYDWLEKDRPAIVIFDPLNNFVSTEESLSNDTIARRTALALNDIAVRFNCFPILVTHFKKESDVRPDNIFEMFHGSKYWTNAAVSQIAMTRANQKKYPGAKEVHFKLKTVANSPSVLLLRDKETLWYREIAPSKISEAKLVAQDVVEVLERRFKGKASPSKFAEIAARDLGCSKRTIWTLLKEAREMGLMIKESGFLLVGEVEEKKKGCHNPRKS